MRSLVILATVGWILVSFLCLERIYADGDKAPTSLKETWIGDTPPPLVAEQGDTKGVTTVIDTPNTIIGSLKKAHGLYVDVQGHAYVAKTPFWLTWDKSTLTHVVFDARHEGDGKLVRVYVFSSPEIVIEEDIQKEP